MDRTDCPVCLSRFELTGEKRAMELPCEHFLCITCLVSWLFECHQDGVTDPNATDIAQCPSRNGTCPQCRHAFLAKAVKEAPLLLRQLLAGGDDTEVDRGEKSSGNPRCFSSNGSPRTRPLSDHNNNNSSSSGSGGGGAIINSGARQCAEPPNIGRIYRARFTLPEVRNRKSWCPQGHPCFSCLYYAATCSQRRADARGPKAPCESRPF